MQRFSPALAALISIFGILSLHPIVAPAQEQRPAMVKTVKAVERPLATRARMTGTLYFEQTSRVSPEEAGKVTRVNFKEGDRVNKGDILVRLDSRILETELALQKARLAQAEIRIRKTKLNLDRYTRLFEKNVASESDYDDLRLTFEEQQQDRVAIARQLDILKIRLSKFIVKAPFDGIVLEKSVETGEWIQPGAVLCRLGAANSLYAKVPVAEDLIGFTRPGDRLDLTLNAFNRKLSARVQGIDPVADPKTKNVSLKLSLDDGTIVPSMNTAENMSVTVMVPVSEKRSLILLPRDALVQTRGQDMIYTVKENKAQPLPAQVLYSKGEEIGVSAPGLSAGMDVVVEGNERLRPGQPVMEREGGEKK